MSRSITTSCRGTSGWLGGGLLVTSVPAGIAAGGAGASEGLSSLVISREIRHL